MKQPEECANLAEVRAEIDRIDRELVRLLGERLGYVRAAAGFKTSVASVPAPERLAAMLTERRAWALDAGLQPEMIEQLFTNLVHYFIAEELRHWRPADQSGADG